MLLDELAAELAQAGVPCTETRFVSAPRGGPFAVLDCACESSPGDCRPGRRDYSATLALVDRLGADSRPLVEAALDARALSWRRGARAWDEAECVFVTEYSLSWAEKA